MAKTLAELFNKYLPTPEQSTVLSGAVATHVKVDKENRLLEVKASFKYIIPKNELYEIEASVAAAYELNHCKILPQYPSVLFSEDYIPEILREAERVGAVARGFFGHYTYISADLKKNEKVKLYCGEGFDLVPKSITKSDRKIFFVVRPMNGNWKGWRMDPKKNPPQIRLDFFEFKDGKFIDITRKS